MTDNEKDIYNKYLRISRTAKNKPYKLRLNFDGFENEENYTHIKKLQLFFEKYNHIKIEDFFNAPYIVYPKTDQIFDLKFYCSYNATKVYSLYNKKLLSLNPDDDIMLKKTKEGLQFIISFCKQQNIKYSEYFNHKTGNINTFWLHLKENNITVFCLFITDNLYKIYNNSDKEVINMMLNNMMENINMYRSLFYNSSKTRKAITEIKTFF